MDRESAGSAGVPAWERPYRWVMLAGLWLLYAAFGMVARSLFPLVTPILADLGISYGQMGLIMGSWQLAYIGAAAIVGAAVDRWGIRRSLALGAVIMALSAGLRYFAGSFPALLLLVALFGVGGPMISVGCPKTIALWFAGNDRATAVGIYSTGPWIGGAFALAATNRWILPLAGNSWRLTFAVYGAITLGVALLWWLLAKDLEGETETGRDGMRRTLVALIGVRNVQVVLAAGLLSFALSHGLTSWLPTILEGKGFSPEAAGTAASLALLGGVPAMLILPRVVPARGRGPAIGAIALLAVASVGALFAFTGAPMLAGMVLYGVTSVAMFPILTLILLDSPAVGPQRMGTAAGLFFCVSEVGGFLSPLIIGLLVDWTGGFLAGAYYLAAVCLAIFLLGFLIEDR
jgi:cyanate permease